MLYLHIPKSAAGGAVSVAVDDLAAASAAYAAVRDGRGEGCSTFKFGTITQDGVPVAAVSYNGNVWPLKNWAPGDKPLYAPDDAVSGQP